MQNHRSFIARFCDTNLFLSHIVGGLSSNDTTMNRACLGALGSISIADDETLMDRLMLEGVFGRLKTCLYIEDV